MPRIPVTVAFPRTIDYLCDNQLAMYARVKRELGREPWLCGHAKRYFAEMHEHYPCPWSTKLFASPDDMPLVELCPWLLDYQI